MNCHLAAIRRLLGRLMFDEGGLLSGPIFAGGSSIKNENLRSCKRISKELLSQDVIREALKSRWSDKLERPQILDRLHSNVGVQGRHLALPIAAYKDLSTWGKA
jgi:hypothetical protein